MRFHAFQSLLLTAIYFVVVIARYVYRGCCGRNEVWSIGKFDEFARNSSRRGFPGKQ